MDAPKRELPDKFVEAVSLLLTVSDQIKQFGRLSEFYEPVAQMGGYIVRLAVTKEDFALGADGLDEVRRELGVEVADQPREDWVLAAESISRDLESVSMLLRETRTGACGFQRGDTCNELGSGG